MASAHGVKEQIFVASPHRIKTLRANDSMKEDLMLRVLYSYDERRSYHGSPQQQASGDLTKIISNLETAGSTVIKWDLASPHSTGRKFMIWDGHHRQEAASYLSAVDKLQDLVASISRKMPTFDRAQHLLQSAMARLEEEFRHLLLSYSDSVDPDWIFQHVSLAPCVNEEESAVLRAYNGDREFAMSPSSAGEEYEEEEEVEEEGDEEIMVAEAVSDLDFTIDLLPSNVISDLNDIAQRMMVGGYANECCQVYASVRKAALDQSVYMLGLEKLSIDDVRKMPWESLEIKIKKWNQALKVVIRVLYASERILCDRIFAGMGPWQEAAFAELAKGPILQLLNFGEAIATSRRSPEKLFKILDMYETLYDLLPIIETTFSDDLCCSVRSEAIGIVMRLGEAARGTFSEFENAIQRDASKIPVPGGGVHPLTRYVMNYICLLLCYTETLKRLLGNKDDAIPKLSGAESNGVLGFSSDVEGANLADHLSPLGVQIVWSIVLLECNLDAKSKLYKDIAQTYLFLMNNVHYIAQKVRQSDLASLVGEEWVNKHVGQVEQHATNYVRAAWKKVLACLREEGGPNVSVRFFSGMSRIAFKDRFKVFNSTFEEVHRTQSSWVVPDPQLREELRISIAEGLIPPYRNFLSRFQGYVPSGRQRDRYLKYTPEDLDKCLLDLFEGASVTMAARRKSFSTSLALAASFH